MESDCLLVEQWSMDHVSTWLRLHDFGNLAQLFSKHQIDGAVLLTMSESDLTSRPLNLSTFGQIRKLGIALDMLRDENTAAKNTKSFRG